MKRLSQRGFLLNPFRFQSGGGGGDQDPDFSKVQLLLHGEGVAGSNAFVDNSSFGRTLLINSGSPSISAAQKKFGASSIYTNGGSINTVVDALGVQDFTFEFFLNPLSSTTANRTLLDLGGNSLLVNLINGQWFQLYDGNQLFRTSVAPTPSEWQHLALVRQANVFRLYHNGIEAGSAAKSINLSGKVCLGGWLDYASENANSYFDEVRLTLGLARYTTNFTPPAAAFPDA